MKVKMPKKRIFINNLSNVEAYLGVGVQEEHFLDSLLLENNCCVKGVVDLLELIPEGFDTKELKKFYKKTGLKLRVEVYTSDYEVVCYDRKGRYPREDAAIWNPVFMNGILKHPEWLEPQEEPDIIIRYVFPVT